MNDPVSTIQPGMISRDIRRRNNMTLDQAAKVAELSKGHLSRFERGEKSLSIASMLRLAKALNTSVSRLLGEEIDEDGFHLVKASDVSTLKVDDASDSYVYQMLSGPANNIQPHTTLIMNIPENASHTAKAYHGGSELLYVLDGGIKFELGKQVMRLEAGDYLEFPGHVPHSIENLAGPSRILLVIIDADRLNY